MTTGTEKNRSRIFVTLLPWAIAGGMLLVYLLTINHAASTSNIYRISELGGWYNPRRYFGPLTFLLTYPLHWLPAASIGFGLNLFTAVCAALTLACLARSVILLPHDRTHEQRQRELSEFSLLTIPTAWLPPLFAALVCGLQMTFWENSTNSAGENPELAMFFADSASQMLDLLLFAYSIRCLLEFRVNPKNSWVACAAFAYGLGMADNWLMIVFFPGFIGALIWIRGVGFFNGRFLATLAIAGLAGFALILFFPIVTAREHLPGFGFWDALRYILRTDKYIFGVMPRELLLLLSLTSLLPIFVIGIRWASYFGDTSQLGIFLATFVFHIVHGLFLLACIWVAFDPPVSPRQKAFDIPLLPLYYLAALSIGYFAGYFLLIFGTRIPKVRRRPHPFVQFINYSVVGFIWVLAVTVPAFLVWKNLRQLRGDQGAYAAFARFTSLTAEALPKEPAVVLSDNPLRLLLLENDLHRSGERDKHLLLDTTLLDHDQAYIHARDKAHPEFKLAEIITNAFPRPLDLIHALEKLAQQHEIYYLHPSFGYYFEHFYAVPQGLVYQLHPYASNEWKEPLPNAEQIKENQQFWNKIAESELPVLNHLIEPSNLVVKSSVMRYFMDAGHLTIESNKPALQLGKWYAQSADYWAVDLERASLLPEAAKRFEETREFNPANISARVNARFNEVLRAGKKIVIESPAAVDEKLGKNRGCVELLNSDGPFDDPSFRYVLGITFAAGARFRENGQEGEGTGGFFQQAMQQFERIHELVPDYADASYWLSKLLLLFNRNSDALAVTEQVLQKNPNDASALFYKGISLMQLGSYDKAVEPFSQVLTLQTNNYRAMLERAIAYLQSSNYPAAKADYEVLAQVATNTYQIDYGLQEVAYHQKDTNAIIKYCELYLTNYYRSIPTNFIPPETAEVKMIKQRLKESKNGAP